MLADWAARHSSTVEIAKLWLFDNAITCAGAQHCARLLAAGTISEVRRCCYAPSASLQI